MTYRESLRWRAFDTHGVLTIDDATELGIPAVELRKLAHRGALERIGRGVYRMAEVPPTAFTEYAEAVALVGPGAVVADESVLALHHLALVNPRSLRVVTPLRIRTALPPTIAVVQRDLRPEDTTTVEGVPTMTIPAALRACRGLVMSDRLLRAVEDAADRNLIARSTARVLATELAPGGAVTCTAPVAVDA